MAITVDRASSQYAEAPACALGSGSLTTFSFAAWYRPSSLTNGTVLSVGDTGSIHYIALAMRATGAVFFEVTQVSTGAAETSGLMTANTWGHIAGTQSSATSRIAYINGVASAPETTSASPTGLDRTNVGCLMFNNSRTSFSGGDIGEAAIWNVALTTAEVASLAAGASPLVVRPQSLVLYAPLRKATTAEQDLKGNLTLAFGAAGAAPTKATTHPRIFGPGGLIITVPAAGAVPAELGGSGDGTSAATGLLTATTSVTATSDGLGAATGALTASSLLSGTTSGIGVASGALTATSVLSGSLAGVGSATSALTATALLTETTSGTGATSGALTASSLIVATSAGTGAVVGSLSATSQLSGATSGVGLVTGALTAASLVTGASAGMGAATGDLMTTPQLSGATAGVGMVAGALTATSQMSDTTTGVGATTGAVAATSLITGASAGTSAVTGDLVATGVAALSGTTEGSGASDGALTATSLFIGATSGTGSITGALTATSLITLDTETTIGNNVIEATVDVNFANNKSGQSASAPESGRITRMDWYLDGQGPGAGSQALRAVVYADSAGLPGALLGSSSEVVVEDGQAGAWVEFSFPTVVHVPAGAVWLVLHVGTVSQTTRRRRASITDASRWNGDTYSDGPTDPFGSSSLDAKRYSVRATLLVPSSTIAAGNGLVTGALATTASIAGTAAGVGSALGTLTASSRITGLAAGVGVATGDIFSPLIVTGSSTGIGATTGYLTSGVTYIAGMGATAASGDLLIPYPDVNIAVNDVLLCDVSNRDNEVLAFPAGWTKKAEANNGTGLRLTIAWRRRAEGDSETNVLVTHADGEQIVGHVHVIRGAYPTGDPFEAATGPTSVAAGTTGAFPDVTMAADGDMLFYTFAYQEDYSTAPSVTNAQGLTLTERELVEVP